jgi:shikimate dehydrogenase
LLQRTLQAKKVFLFGHPVSHSLSPSMQNAAFQRLGVRARYLVLDVPPDCVATAVELLRLPDVLGANVTVPHKEAVLGHLDHLEDDARRLGSVNTIYKRKGRLHGASTDGPGFLRSLGSAARRLSGGKVLLVGAGGAARAVAGALSTAGVKRLRVMDLDARRATGLVRLLREFRRGMESAIVSKREAELDLGDYDLVVQATPLGLHPKDPAPLSLERIAKGCLAVDLVYHRKTRFLQEAADQGARTMSGLGMLLHQGALAFEKWTARKAPIMVMERSLRRALKRRS